MTYEEACPSADEASHRAQQARAKMNECVALLKTEADERRRQRIFVDYVTLFGLWLEYKREHLRSLDAPSDDLDPTMRSGAPDPDGHSAGFRQRLQ